MNDFKKNIIADLTDNFPKVRTQDQMGRFLSFALIVVAPLIIASLYYVNFAVAVYETDASVAVRKEAAMPQDNVGVSLGSASALAVYADSFIVAEYAKSREAVEGVRQTVNVDQFFLKGAKDPLYRFPENASMEQIIAYWQDMVDADFDAATGIIKLKVRAFDPDDALNIANSLALLLRNLVAKLSEKSQQEAVRFAELSLQKSVESLNKHRQAIQQFRIDNEIVDPASEVANLNALITTLSQELIKFKTEQAVMRATSINNPKIKQLDIKIRNTLKIMQEIRKGTADFEYVGRLPGLLRSYELLKTNFEIANEQYTKALEQFTQATATAVLRQAHLYVFVDFSKPQSPIRPDLPFSLLKLFLVCLSLWGIYRLII